MLPFGGPKLSLPSRLSDTFRFEDESEIGVEMYRRKCSVNANIKCKNLTITKVCGLFT